MHLPYFLFGLGLAMAVAPLEALQMADNLRNCFNVIEETMTTAITAANEPFLQLHGRLQEGRDIISSCEKANPNNPQFAYCFAAQAEDLRITSLESLSQVQGSLGRLSSELQRIIADGISCVSAQLPQ